MEWQERKMYLVFLESCNCLTTCGWLHLYHHILYLFILVSIVGKLLWGLCISFDWKHQRYDCKNYIKVMLGGLILRAWHSRTLFEGALFTAALPNMQAEGAAVWSVERQFRLNVLRQKLYAAKKSCVFCLQVQQPFAVDVVTLKSCQYSNLLHH